MTRQVLRSKANAETRNEVFDFTSRLATGETISSAATSATVYSGSDSAPQAIISGSASISGAQVTQKLIGGVEGVIYLVDCAATTSASQVIHLYGYLAILPGDLC